MSSYYSSLKEQFEDFISGNELLSITLLLEVVSPQTISLFTTDVKTHMLIGVNREIRAETLKSLSVRAKALARTSNVMWDTLLPTEDVRKINGRENPRYYPGPLP